MRLSAALYEMSVTRLQNDVHYTRKRAALYPIKVVGGIYIDVYTFLKLPTGQKEAKHPVSKGSQPEKKDFRGVSCLQLQYQALPPESNSFDCGSQIGHHKMFLLSPRTFFVLSF